MMTLSDRERAVARMTAAGHAPASIATALAVSVRSVENLLYALYAKFGVSSTEEFIAIAGPTLD